jgi:signal transduction histidine kinase
MNDPNPPTGIAFLQNLALFSFALIPIAIGFSVMKYRLYDIDVVINKAVVFGALAAFITIVYVGIVAGIGALFNQGARPNAALSIAATAVVAIAFQPVRGRVQHLANRMVYGKRATPYEVLSEFSEQIGGAVATEDLLPQMAKTLAEGAGAARADVWLRRNDELRVDASWPADAPPPGLVRADSPPDELVLVRHQGDLLGALSVEKKPGESLTPTEAKLLNDLASQAGLVLRNVGLTEQLLARLGDLRASRQRLVAAQDEERRKIERNLHDGAQQQLVALAIKVNLARSLASKDPDKAGQILGDVKDELQEALDTLRDLARGIYPPVLADKGLAAALSAQAAKVANPVSVEADGVGRYPQELEAAIYFCCLEALQNISKYAQASAARLSLRRQDGEIVFNISDDGRGFDPEATPRGSGTTNMADRIEALGGSLQIESAPGQGTTIHGRVPAPHSNELAS